MSQTNGNDIALPSITAESPPADTASSAPVAPSPAIGDAQDVPAAPTPAPAPAPLPVAANDADKESKTAPHVVTIHTGDPSGTAKTKEASPRPDPSQPVTDPSLWQYPWETSCDMETAEKRRLEQQDADKHHPYVPHQGQYRQYMRDIILGVNDGLVSMFLLLIGLVGGGAHSRDILLAGITGAVAGAISMALGEYIATKSQSEVVEGDLNLEKEHFRYHRRMEMEQVYDELKQKLGLYGETLNAATRQIGESNESMLNFMKAFEFGFTEQDNRSPVTAMAMSGALFITGSLPSVVPFFFVDNNRDGLISAAVLCGVALMLVGAIKTMATRTSALRAALENLTIGGLAAGVSYGVGSIYTAVVGDGHTLT